MLCCHWHFHSWLGNSNPCLGNFRGAGIPAVLPNVTSASDPDHVDSGILGCVIRCGVSFLVTGYANRVDVQSVVFLRSQSFLKAVLPFLQGVNGPAQIQRISRAKVPLEESSRRRRRLNFGKGSHTQVARTMHEFRTLPDTMTL